MVASQWEHACKLFASQIEDTNYQVIDYGCGQGLAGLLIHDYVGPSFLRQVRAIVAIEPSAVALSRAGAIYESLATEARVTLVNKAFTDLEGADFAAGVGS